jgi:hypothetical protein
MEDIMKCDLTMQTDFGKVSARYGRIIRIKPSQRNCRSEVLSSEYPCHILNFDALYFSFLFVSGMVYIYHELYKCVLVYSRDIFLLDGANYKLVHW